MSEFKHIVLDLNDNVATLAINRPEVMNAVTTDTADEIRLALDGLRNSGARALILTGNGRAFCAGADLGGKTFGNSSPGDRSRRDMQQHFNPMMLGLNGLDIPIVTAVNGAAAGIGCSMALSGDLIVAGRSAYFLQAFVNIGLVPDGGSSWLLPKLAGLPVAMDMMLNGERMSAESAENIGLINWCVDDDQVMEKAKSVAAKLASGPTVAMGMMRQLIRGAQHMSFPEVLAHEAECQKRALDSEDAAEGIKAFQEKRKPNFKGK